MQKYKCISTSLKSHGKTSIINLIKLQTWLHKKFTNIGAPENYKIEKRNRFIESFYSLHIITASAFI